MAHADIGGGNQDIDGVDLGLLIRLRLRRLFRPTGQHGGNAACGIGNGQHDETRGFHTLTLTVTRRPRAPSIPTRIHMAANTTARTDNSS
jgi:hypothetical protein